MPPVRPGCDTKPNSIHTCAKARALGGSTFFFASFTSDDRPPLYCPSATSFRLFQSAIAFEDDALVRFLDATSQSAATISQQCVHINSMSFDAESICPPGTKDVHDES